MSGSQPTRLDRLEAARTDITTELVVRRHDADAVLFSRTIRRLDPAVVDLGWPERKEIVESMKDHTLPEVEVDMVQHRYCSRRCGL